MNLIDIISVDTTLSTNEDGGGGYNNAYYQNLRDKNKKKQQEKDQQQRKDTESFQLETSDKSLEQRLMELGAKYKAKADGVAYVTRNVQDGIYISRQVSPEALLEIQNDEQPNPFREQFQKAKTAIEEQAKQEQQETEQQLDNDIFNRVYDKLLAEIYNKLYNELYSKLYAVINSEIGDETERLHLKLKSQKQYVAMLEERVDELELQIKNLQKKTNAT
ncbi:hypothetical protein FACS1894132_03240 [Clostridia bacterium]|nr:hypothetical protein FACS1894132_03240 [Clostridia bacterium]